MNYNDRNKVLQFPQIGDVYFMKFGGIGSVQTGWRPGVVLQNNKGNRYSPNIIALPMTSVIKKSCQPTHVIVKADDTGLPRDSMVLGENPECIPKELIGDFITRLPDTYMKQVAAAHTLASSAISFMDLETLRLVWEKANELNDQSA